jgi:uncharacterized membrane protein
MNESQRPTLAALVALYLFSAIALGGYWSFGLHPQLLSHIGPFASFYGVAFRFFGQAQVWLAGAVLVFLLVRAVGWVWVGAFAAVYAISLGSELAGTTWGIPFGAYGYTDLLGVRWLDRVPVVIPLSWFTMALPAYALARRRFGPGRGLSVALLGSFALLIWDLSLDPAMSYATPYWWWGEVGPYYGMPLLNLLGWYLTGLALMFAFQGLRADRWTDRLSPGVWAAYYGGNLLLPIGMCVAAGLWGAVLLSVATLVGVGVLLWAPAPEREPLALAMVDS